tara:strand:- start:87 stop:401 length:315 start_codon:yes stop_codon:yes gene_type:complete
MKGIRSLPHPMSLRVTQARADIVRCFVAYKRHRDKNMLGVLYLYWLTMDPRGKSKYGRDVFIDYIMTRLRFIQKQTPWLADQIRMSFLKEGLNLPDYDGFYVWK